MDEAAAALPEPPTTTVDSDTCIEGCTDTVETAGILATLNAPALPSPVALGKQRAGRRGLAATRKRLGLALKIDASEASCGQKDSEAREGLSTSDGTPSSVNDVSDADAKALADAVPWWVLEYKCPPPGHLGAHDVSVPAAEAAAAQSPAHEVVSLVSATKQDDDGDVKLVPRVLDGVTTQSAALATDQPSSGGDKRPRRQQQNRKSIDDSPSQKRKMDPSAPSPAVVTKEPKRFHERSTAAASNSGSCSPTALTPTVLVRPLNKIDIDSERSASASVAGAGATVPPPPVAAANVAKSSANTNHASSSA